MKHYFVFVFLAVVLLFFHFRNLFIGLLLVLCMLYGIGTAIYRMVSRHAKSEYDGL